MARINRLSPLAPSTKPVTAAAQEEIARLRALLEELKAAYPDARLGSLAISLQNTKDEDWENNWKQYYQPIEIGEKLLVVPKWMDPETKELRSFDKEALEEVRKQVARREAVVTSSQR